MALKAHGVTSSHEVLTEKMYTKMMMQSIKTEDLLEGDASYVSVDVQCQASTSSSATSSLLSETTSRSVTSSSLPAAMSTLASSSLLKAHSHSDVDMRLFRVTLSNLAMSNLALSNGGDSLQGKVLGRVVDIGGQPQLFELLPRFISEISLGVVVTDLSQNLSDYPICYFYGEDGKPVGEGIKSNLTNEQIFRVFLQMLKSQSNMQKKVNIMIVGTHKDVEHKSKETRKQKEEKLQDIITTFGLNDNILYTDETCSKVIFAVNALNPTEEDYAIGQKIMAETMNTKHAQLVSIPIKHHNLELTLKQLSKSKKIAISIDCVLHKVKHYYENEETLKEGLRFLHHTFRIFFFKDLPNLVFGEPQLLLNFMTKVTVHHIKLATNPTLNQTCTGSWKKFKEQGIITEDILVSISDVFDDTLTPTLMIEVMEKLHIVCNIGDGEFLMPSLLTALASLPLAKPSSWLRWLPFGLGHYLSDLLSGFKCEVTVLLHFPCGLVRFGVFCSTVCELITTYKWELAGTMSRNRFYFTRPHCAGTVALIDSFDSFVAINLDIPLKVSSLALPHICSEVQNTILGAIKKVTRDLRYSEDQPIVSFICKYHHKTPHAAEYDAIHQHLLCTKDSSVINSIEDRHRVWLKDFAAPVHSGLPQSQEQSKSLSNSRQTNLKELLQILDMKEDTLKGCVSECGLDFIARNICHKDWRTYASELKIPKNTMDDIKEDHARAKEQRIEGLKEWKKREGLRAKYIVLVELVLKHNNAELAEDICKYVKHDCCTTPQHY